MIVVITNILQKDSNSVVISNAIIALAEISEMKGTNLVNIDNTNIDKILSALSECNDWGQVFILDNLMEFEPKDQKIAEKVIDKVLPRLSHINNAVVLAGIKVMIRFMGFITNKPLIQG